MSDINPFFEKRIDTEWMGVRIKASIIIDESLKDEIESIEMMDLLLAGLLLELYLWCGILSTAVLFGMHITHQLRETDG